MDEELLLLVVFLILLPWQCREEILGTHGKLSRQHLEQGVSPEHRHRPVVQAAQARPTLMLLAVKLGELDAVLLAAEELA